MAIHHAILQVNSLYRCKPM